MKPDKICITLATYPARINSLLPTLESLFAQTMKADKIVVNLCLGEFPQKRIPEYLYKLVADGKVEILWREWNCQAYGKHIPTLEKYGNEYIYWIVDDDVIYPPDNLEALYKTFTDNGGNQPVSVYHRPMFGRKHHLHGNNSLVAYGMLMPALKDIFDEFINNPYEEWKCAEDVATTYATYILGFSPVPCPVLDWTDTWREHQRFGAGLTDYANPRWKPNLQRFKKELKLFVEKKYETIIY